MRWRCRFTSLYSFAAALNAVKAMIAVQHDAMALPIAYSRRRSWHSFDAYCKNGTEKPTAWGWFKASGLGIKSDPAMSQHLTSHTYEFFRPGHNTAHCEALKMNTPPTARTHRSIFDYLISNPLIGQKCKFSQ